jgi:hypothetical protein
MISSGEPTDTHCSPALEQAAMTPAPAAAAAPPVAIMTGLPAPRAGEESALDDLFARLNAHGASKPPDSAEATSPLRPEGIVFSFEDGPGVHDAGPDVLDSQSLNTAGATMGSDASISDAAVVAQDHETDHPEKVAKNASVNDHGDTQDMSHVDVEQLYLRKAADYLQALPSGNIVSVETIKGVSKKLRSTYAPAAKLSGEEAEKLKARYAFAIFNYVNQVCNKSAKPITSDFAKKALHDADGDMFRVFAKLVEEKYISLDDMDNAAGLCKMISHALPKAEVATAPATSKAESTTPSATGPKPVLSSSASKDPLDGLKAWPTQEKRATRE